MGGLFERPHAVLRAILDSPQGIVIFALDDRYRYLAFNENHARTIKHIWGVDIAVGMVMLDVIGREDDRIKARHSFDRALAGESFTLIEEYGDERMLRRIYQDVYSPIRDDDGTIIGLAVYLTDITEQRAAQIELDNYRNRLEDLVKQRTVELEALHAQLLYAQKMESLGVLAGGIAHDFNNLLSVILGRAELAERVLGPNHAAREHIEIARETAIQARILTRQLLGYAGKGKFLIQKVGLNDLVQNMAQLLRASVRKTIHLEFDCTEPDVVVEIDVTQIRQVVLNLVTNGAEAIGEESGKVVVRTRVVDVDDDVLGRVCGQTGLRAGRHGCIEVEDTGSGMDDRIRTKLFDPFFTTKLAGRGLGLAAVLGIVTSHKGGILLRTAPGEGSRFSVLLPLSEGPAELLERSPDRKKSFRGSGAVLVVDDEEPVRIVAAEMLGSLGFEVLSANGGKEACQLYRQHADRIRFVLLDLVMPDQNGEQTFRALQAIDSAVRVIVVTGYTEDEVQLRFVQEELAGFLTKPFVQDELIGVLQRAQSWRPSRPAPRARP